MCVCIQFCWVSARFYMVLFYGYNHFLDVVCCGSCQVVISSHGLSASPSILTSPIILHVWNLISSWHLILKRSSSFRIWCHLNLKFLGPSAQPRSCHMGSRPPLVCRYSACKTGPRVIVLLAHFLWRKSSNLWPITTVQRRYISYLIP